VDGVHHRPQATPVDAVRRLLSRVSSARPVHDELINLPDPARNPQRERRTATERACRASHSGPTARTSWSATPPDVVIPCGCLTPPLPGYCVCITTTVPYGPPPTRLDDVITYLPADSDVPHPVV